TVVLSFAICTSMSSYRFSFFFQAEDGIRDRNVTGVQTCALPIYIDYILILLLFLLNLHFLKMHLLYLRLQALVLDQVYLVSSVRSEERRVGKGCRSRWAP